MELVGGCGEEGGVGGECGEGVEDADVEGGVGELEDGVVLVDVEEVLCGLGEVDDVAVGDEYAFWLAG